MAAGPGFDPAAHLPALQVMVPLIGSVVCAAVRQRHVCAALTIACSLAMPVIAFAILWQVRETGTISYAMGGWAPPIGYANAIAVDAGRIVFIAGQVGWNEQQQFETPDIVPQFEQALKNLLAVLPQAGGEAQHICRMTAYCRDKPAYLHLSRDPAEIAAMRAIKDAVDPRHLMNPGVLFTSETPVAATMVTP